MYYTSFNFKLTLTLSGENLDTSSSIHWPFRKFHLYLRKGRWIRNSGSYFSVILKLIFVKGRKQILRYQKTLYSRYSTSKKLYMKRKLVKGKYITPVFPISQSFIRKTLQFLRFCFISFSLTPKNIEISFTRFNQLDNAFSKKKNYNFTLIARKTKATQKSSL